MKLQGPCVAETVLRWKVKFVFMGLYVRVNNPFYRELLPPKSSQMFLWPEFCHMLTPKPDIFYDNGMIMFHLDWSKLTP